MRKTIFNLIYIIIYTYDNIYCRFQINLFISNLNNGKKLNKLISEIKKSTDLLKIKTKPIFHFCSNITYINYYLKQKSFQK